MLLGDFKLGDDVKVEALRTLTKALSLTLNSTVCLALMPVTTLDSLAATAVLNSHLSDYEQASSEPLLESSPESFSRTPQWLAVARRNTTSLYAVCDGPGARH